MAQDVLGLLILFPPCVVVAVGIWLRTCWGYWLLILFPPYVVMAVGAQDVLGLLILFPQRVLVPCGSWGSGRAGASDALPPHVLLWQFGLRSWGF